MITTKKLLTVIIILFMYQGIIICSPLPSDSIKVNQHFNLLLKDDSEVEGKVLKVDSSIVVIKIENDDILQIERKDITRIIKNEYYDLLISGGFLYGLNTGDEHNYPETISSKFKGFSLAVESRLNGNVWLKIGYEFKIKKEEHASSEMYPYEYKNTYTHHMIKALICLHKIRNDVFVSPGISGGVGINEQLESHHEKYFDYFTQTYQYRNYDYNAFSVSLEIEAGLNIKLYKNIMLYFEAGYSIGVIPPYSMFYNYSNIPIKTGIVVGL